MGKARLFLERDHLVKGLFVKEFGPEGPDGLDTPLLMVPGGSHGWWAFEVWLPFFASSGWQSFSLSLRNHTGSYSLPDEEFVRLTMDDYVHDVSTVLAWLEKPAVLIGHSMGGIIVQKIAEKTALKAMVLVASVGPGQLGPIRDPLPTDKPILLDPDTVRTIWFHRIDDEHFKRIYSRLTPESPEVMNEYSTGRVRVDRRAINCPILVIRGACDRTVVHAAEALADFYSAPYQIEPDCGHDLMLEPSALDVAQKINQWLLSVVSTDPIHSGDTIPNSVQRPSHSRPTKSLQETLRSGPHFQVCIYATKSHFGKEFGFRLINLHVSMCMHAETIILQ